MMGHGGALLGGILLGLAAMLLLLANGRVAGISGILAGLLGGQRIGPRIAFVVGLVAGPWLSTAVFHQRPTLHIAASLPVVMVAGLLVGIGTRMGSGCTSGHGIVGLARGSKRSLAATATFLVSGIIVATVAGLWR